MEPLTSDGRADASTAHLLRGRIARWMTTADRRLRIGGEWPVAAALREGMELAAEELRVEEESLVEEVDHAASRVARLTALLDNAPVALLVTTRDGRIAEANVAARRLLDGGRRGLLGSVLVRSVTLEDRRAFRTLLDTLAAAAADRELPLRLHQVGGAVLAVVATVRSAADASGETMLYWALREDRRALDDELL